MTNDQINRAIAEACGWSQVGHNGYQPVWANSKGERWAESHLPDYANDLNAMHEAENILDIHTSNRMTGWLLMLLGEENQASIYSFTAVRRATACQRAEAFLRTIGKWEEARK